jgi:poly(3-hydroxybutyrate) depolymerase
MQRIGWFVAVVMTMGVVAGCPITQSQDVPNEILTRHDNVTGVEYYLYVPSSYDGKKPMPLVMTLHGTWPWDQAWMQIREWVALAEEKGFIVVAPLLSDISTHGILPVSDSVRTERLINDDRSILAIRREILTRYSIDSKQVILTGFSAGGFPMYYTGLRHPEKFAILIARACNSDEQLLAATPSISEEAVRPPVGIFVGKDDGALQEFAWGALRYLRRNGWSKNNSTLINTDGGHLRRPRTAWKLWTEYQRKGRF